VRLLFKKWEFLFLVSALSFVIVTYAMEDKSCSVSGASDGTDVVNINRKIFCSNRDNVVEFLRLVYTTAALVRAEVFNRGKNDPICMKLRALVNEGYEYLHGRSADFYAFAPACNALNMWRDPVRKVLQEKHKRHNGEVSLPPLCLGSWALVSALTVKAAKVIQEDVDRLCEPYFFAEESQASTLGCPPSAHELCVIL